MAKRWHERVVLWWLRLGWRISRGVTLGVRVAVFDPHGRVLLVRHGYLPGWHLPGGGVDRGERVSQAARREVYEETGLQIAGDLQWLGMYANFEAFPGDHVAVFVSNSFLGALRTDSSYEIADRRFCEVSDLPEGTTAGTRRRLAEIAGKAPVAADW
jgi:ADP-ribose pyrophosphatase YjhB (NUDIX family)